MEAIITIETIDNIESMEPLQAMETIEITETTETTRPRLWWMLSFCGVLHGPSRQACPLLGEKRQVSDVKLWDMKFDDAAATGCLKIPCSATPAVDRRQWAAVAEGRQRQDPRGCPSVLAHGRPPVCPAHYRREAMPGRPPRRPLHIPPPVVVL